jgi:hypothetical protein
MAFLSRACLLAREVSRGSGQRPHFSTGKLVAQWAALGSAISDRFARGIIPEHQIDEYRAKANISKETLVFLEVGSRLLHCAVTPASIMSRLGKRGPASGASVSAGARGPADCCLALCSVAGLVGGRLGSLKPREGGERNGVWNSIRASNWR